MLDPSVVSLYAFHNTECQKLKEKSAKTMKLKKSSNRIKKLKLETINKLLNMKDSKKDHKNPVALKYALRKDLKEKTD